MRKLRIMEHISLDGVIEIASGPGQDSGFPYGDWTSPYRSPAGLQIVTGLYGERFDVLLGRRTYDQWSGFWPTAPQSPMADRLNAATKYVVTHRPESLAWGPFQGLPTPAKTQGEPLPTASSAELLDAVRTLKASEGPDLVVSGSSTLTSMLFEHGLVDELILLVNPVLLGKGKRLFADGTPPRSFTLAGTQSLPSGILINRYNLAGPLLNLK